MVKLWSYSSGYKTVLLEILFFLLSSLLFLVSGGDGIGLIVILFIFLFFKKISLAEERLYVSLGFLIALALMLLIYMYWEWLYGFPYFMGKVTDDWVLEDWAIRYYSLYGLSPLYINDYLPVGFNSTGYVYFLVVVQGVYELVGGSYSTLIPRIVNIFFLVLVGLVSSRLVGKVLEGRSYNKLSFWFVLLYPMMLYVSAHVFRDIIVSFIFVSVVYMIYGNKLTFVRFVYLSLCGYVLIYFRVEMVVLYISILILYYVDHKYMIAVGLLCVIVLVVLFGDGDYMVSLLSKYNRYEDINLERRGELGRKIFEYPIYIGIIPRVIVLFFSPVPKINTFHDMLLSAGVGLQLFSLPYLIRGFFSKNIDKYVKYVFFIMFLSVAMSTMTFRHYLWYLPFGVIFAIICYDRFGFAGYNYHFLSILFAVFVLGVFLIV